VGLTGDGAFKLVGISLTMIKIANAPCSWGALEFDLEGEAPDYVQVLNEIAETGYAGTELGDLGIHAD
jgi:hypothetical protein